jgi:hypothetical protein
MQVQLALVSEYVNIAMYYDGIYHWTEVLKSRSCLDRIWLIFSTSTTIGTSHHEMSGHQPLQMGVESVDWFIPLGSMKRVEHQHCVPPIVEVLSIFLVTGFFHSASG